MAAPFLALQCRVGSESWHTLERLEHDGSDIDRVRALLALKNARTLWEFNYAPLASAAFRIVTSETLEAETEAYEVKNGTLY